MSELTWKRIGYTRCSKCDARVPKDCLHSMNDKGVHIEVCGSCFDRSCFECHKKWNVRFVETKNHGWLWLCQWCQRIYRVKESELNG